MKYLIISPGEREITIEANNSTQAKRKACRIWGISPSDCWCGISALKALQIKQEMKTSIGDQTYAM